MSAGADPKSRPKTDISREEVARGLGKGRKQDWDEGELSGTVAEAQPSGGSPELG